MDFSSSAADEAFRARARAWLAANRPERPERVPHDDASLADEFRVLLDWQRRLHAAWRTLKLQMARWLVRLQRDRSTASGHKLADSIEPHRRLLRLLLAGKAKAAETEMRWHIGQWAEWLPETKIKA